MVVTHIFCHLPSSAPFFSQEVNPFKPPSLDSSTASIPPFTDRQGVATASHPDTLLSLKRATTSSCPHALQTNLSYSPL
jgi:hypothetical protein